MPIKYARRKRTNYENFIAECPYCGKENIFNRISDLQTIQPITFMEVKCFECNKEFNINGDKITESYEYLIYDCCELLRTKRYMYCIFNLCQACEAFLLKAIETKTILEPWKRRILYRRVNVLNEYRKRLFDSVEGYSYERLRNLFLDLYIYNKSFNDQQDIDDYLEGIVSIVNHCPPEAVIKNYPDQRTRDLLLDLHGLDINKIRNKVVHKYAFRPSSQDVQKYWDSVGRIIYGLRQRLRILHTISYLNG